MTTPIQPVTNENGQPDLQRTFQQSIGSTFFRQMLKSMRNTTGKPAYMHGGQAEEMFQSQLDELLIEKMAESSGGTFADDLFEQQFPHHSSASSEESARSARSVRETLSQENQRHIPGSGFSSEA